MSFKEALRRLEALPARRLIRGAWHRDGRSCALGACDPVATAHFGIESVSWLDDHGRVAWLAPLGLTVDEARRLERENDRVAPRDESEPARFDRVLAWLRARVAAEDDDG